MAVVRWVGGYGRSRELEGLRKLQTWRVQEAGVMEGRV